MSYERLSSPLAIGGLELKNRMVIPAMHTASTKDGACTGRFLDFYRRRAMGGAGLIITGSCRFDEYGSDRLSMSLASDDRIPGWKAFTDEMHELGCPVGVQLFHAGRYVREKDVICRKPALSPSEGYCRFTRETTPGMTAGQIEELLHAYYLGAKRAVQAGFDAVEISGSSGYLLCQFLSPLINKRTDQYGGSFENRCRLPLQAIRTVREAVGPDYPVLYRLGADDLVEDSNSVEDLLPFAVLAEKAGVDCFNVTGGWHESRVPQLTGEVPKAGLRFLTGAVKEAVSVPVIANNRINDPYTAEKILALGYADLAGVGRACIADPDFPKKVLEDRAREIRPCIACNQGCLGNVFFGKPIACHVNSRIGSECDSQEARHGADGIFVNGSKEKILVIGGGPAGCEAALTAASKGKEVVLWEKSDVLGGQLKLAAKLPGKQEFFDLIRYYEYNLAINGAKIRLNTEFGEDDAAKLQEFDHIVCAWGGRRIMRDLFREAPCIPVYSYEDILLNRVAAGRRVAVIGGSFIGCETARFLVREASLQAEDLYYLSRYPVCSDSGIREMTGKSRREVFIIEKNSRIGYGYEPGTAWPVLDDLDYFGAKKFKNTEVVKVLADGVLIRDEDGKESRIGCDTVVTSFGVRPGEMIKKLEGKFSGTISVIGNAKKTGRSMDAIADGHRLF